MSSTANVGTSKTIEDRIKAILVENLGVPKADIKPESDLAVDLGADSLDNIEILMALEDEFALEVSDEHAEAWKTVSDISAYFEERVPK